MRKAFLAAFILLAAVFVLFVYTGTDTLVLSDIARYYIQNFAVDTGAGSGIAAVYLNYRLFDSIFETLILLVSVLSVIHFTGRSGHE